MSTNRAKSPSYGSREETPPVEHKDHYLFLLEFFVKQVLSKRLAKLNQMFYVPTCVRFGFLDFLDEDDLQVTPVDSLFQPQAGAAYGAEVFNVGKSVLFAVDFDAVTDRNAKMILEIRVIKRMPEDVKPNILVGMGTLDLSDQYAALRMETLQCWRKGVTTSKVFDGRVPLIGSKDSLDVFVRMSVFGQTIVTEFDAPASRDLTTFVFSAEETDEPLAYKCRKVDSSTVDLFEDRRSAKCPVCLPERYPCVPCGKMTSAVEERETRDKRDDKVVTEKKLKHMISSKGLIQSSRGPAQPCGNPVVLKVSGLFDNGDGIGGKKPTVTVADESTKPGESDRDHDIFVLRIGKKGLVGIGEKSDIQLEMKTPKGPERKPPIRYETRDMQTDVVKESVKATKKKKKKKK